MSSHSVLRSVGAKAPTTCGQGTVTTRLNPSKIRGKISVDTTQNQRFAAPDGGSQSTAGTPKLLNRRDWFRNAVGGGVGLALGGLIDLPTVRAANEKLKLSNVQEFTTSCNFCSCGCGMVAAVREGKLIAMEGDYDHIVNRGSLCVKGISMFATHTSPDRLANPRYRAPGSDRWEEISWENALERIAQKLRKTRDATWIAAEKLGDGE